MSWGVVSLVQMNSGSDEDVGAASKVISEVALHAALAGKNCGGSKTGALLFIFRIS